MNIDESAAATASRSRDGLRDWLLAVARSSVGLAPRLDTLRATPAGLAWLLLGALLFSVAEGWLLEPGELQFYPAALQYGWLSTLVLLWLCWRVLHRRGAADAAPPSAGVAMLFGVLLGQGIAIGIAASAAHLALPRGATLVGWLYLLWLWAAALVLLLRQLPGRRGVAAQVAVVWTLALLTMVLLPPPRLWYAQPQAAGASAPMQLSPALIERQGGLLARAADDLAPQRPGVIDLYAIGFAPYAQEEVFRRELALVGGVMRERFDARGRTLDLLNHAATAAELPWATAENLERAIHAVAARMDRDEDILFIHLTSHGSRDGQLEASLWPLQLDPVTPRRLADWLDAAGVRWRVVSVSACYSGSWIEPLAGEGTLVMTAADAQHTSYGCGHQSELTFFGRAMYDDALRQTRSFELAHARARVLIEQREQDAGKDDGFSNPQISLGSALRPRLARLEARLETPSLQ